MLERSILLYCEVYLMISQKVGKVVTPAKAGVQNYLN